MRLQEIIVQLEELVKANADLANKYLFQNKQPSETLPDTFPAAQKTKMVHDFLPRGEGGEYTPSKNEITLNSVDPQTWQAVPQQLKERLAQNFMPKQSYGHELGHAVYMNDLSPEIQSNWTDLIHKYTANIPGPQTEEQAKAYSASPSPLYSYIGNTGHQFADYYGQYVAQPEKLKREMPEIYQFFQNLAKFEYSRKLK